MILTKSVSIGVLDIPNVPILKECNKITLYEHEKNALYKIGIDPASDNISSVAFIYGMSDRTNTNKSKAVADGYEIQIKYKIK